MRPLLILAVAGLACGSRPSGVRHADGQVVGSDHEPVAGALISVIDPRSFQGVEFAVSDQRGRFSIHLPSISVVVTATAHGHVAGLISPGAGERLGFVLAEPSSATRRFSGIVVDTTGHPLDRVRVRLMHWSWPTGAAFYTISDGAGRFTLSVDAAGSFDLAVDDPRYVSAFAPAPQHAGARLIAYERAWLAREANRVDEVALRELCVPLHEDGVRRLAGSLRDAVAVGLGEATHGTRELTEARGLVIDELIRDGWLTTIALEASWVEVARVDDYVRRGVGTAREVVASLAYWPWRTEELVALVEAVRKRNDQLPADRKIELLGIDYAPPEATAEFLRRAFPGADALSALEPLHRIVNWLELSKMSSQEREALSRALGALEHRSGSLPAVQGIRITRQIIEGRDDDFRDRVMADAVLALLARSDRVRHVAIWAHNQHVAEGPAEGSLPLGFHLKQRLADQYRAIGTMFYDGSFRTYSGLEDRMVSHVVTPPPAFYLESALRRVSPSSACALDVAEATRHPRLRDWIAVPKLVRNYGGLEISESYPWPPVIIPDLWSAMIFVPRSTPTRSLD